MTLSDTDVLLQQSIAECDASQGRSLRIDDIQGLSAAAIHELTQRYPKISVFSARNCDLTTVDALESLTELEECRLAGNTRLQETPSLGRIWNLEVLDLEGCPVRDFSFLRSLSLCQLHLSSVPGKACESLANSITGMTRLRLLTLNNTQLHESAALRKALESLTGIEYIDISNTGISSIEFVHTMKHLRVLVCKDNPGLKSINGIEKLTGLRSAVFDRSNIKDGLRPIRGCTGLRKLSIRETKIPSLSPISDMENLIRAERSHPGLLGLVIGGGAEPYLDKKLQEILANGNAHSRTEDILNHCGSIRYRLRDGLSRAILRSILRYYTQTDNRLKSASGIPFIVGTTLFGALVSQGVEWTCKADTPQEDGDNQSSGDSKTRTPAASSRDAPP